MKNLLNLSFHNKLLVRTPAMAFSNFSADKMQAVLRDAAFKQALMLASEELYAELAKCHFDFSKLNIALRLAVFKYYNRMSYRSIPFGSFASVALINWSQTAQPMVRSEGHRLQVFPDFGLLDKTILPLHRDTLLYPNPSIYKLGKDFRYVARYKQEGEPRAVFRIMSIAKSLLIKKLFEFLRSPQSYALAIDFLQKELGKENAADIVASLINSQVLYHSSMPAITRTKFPILKNQMSGARENYAVAYHDQQGSLDKVYQKDIRDGLFALTRLSGAADNESLADFAKKFSDKYGIAEVPILRALDPQIGISYLGNEETALQQQSTKVPVVPKPEERISLQGNEKLAVLLMKKVTFLAQGGGNFISFSEEELLDLEDTHIEKIKYPPSFPVIFRLTPGFIVLDSVGGSSAIGIAGRFSHDQVIQQQLRLIAAHEQHKNPGVVFAELAAMDNSATDNISTRSHLRNFEIPVLTHSELPGDRRITLDDLYLQVVNGRVVLRSRKLNKEVIPRLSSAYNYTLSNLPLLRFLGDLQFQGIRHNLSFDPRALLPGLEHYPRTVYRNCILSPAKWIWKAETLKDLVPTKKGLEKFIGRAKDSKLPRFFSIIDHDRELVYDLESESSLMYFLQCIKNKSEIVLKEKFLPEGPSTIKNNRGGSYAGQMIAFLQNQETVYSGDLTCRSFKTKKEVHLPGNRWLYFKIYGHLESLNVFLLDKRFSKMISRFITMDAIQCWYFVRYVDTGPHLRIRLKIRESYGTAITSQMSNLVKKYIKKELISDLVVAAYEPELERYGRAGMKRVEHIFCSSSKAVLAFHRRLVTAQQEICFAVASIALLLSELLPESEIREDFVCTVSNNSVVETKFRIQLDQYYRLNRKEIEQATLDPYSLFGKGVSAKLEKMSLRCAELRKATIDKEQALDTGLVADLVHMHLNRMNASGTIQLESASYYLLRKCYRAFAGTKSSTTPDTEILAGTTNGV
jgi:thiopeptide-type bacteriocin biosynthesis protein